MRSRGRDQTQATIRMAKWSKVVTESVARRNPEVVHRLGTGRQQLSGGTVEALIISVGIRRYRGWWWTRAGRIDQLGRALRSVFEPRPPHDTVLSTSLGGWCEPEFVGKAM